MSDEIQSALPCSIAERKWNSDTIPLLSIQCLTYNHQNYITECIESFLMQVTYFPVEIIIHDDASTDGTAEILKHYQKLYPGVIKLILQSTNQFQAGNDPNNFIIPMIQGRYIARCEGDDFWTDAKKLQTQVDFLKSHPEYVVSCHDSSVINENGDLIRASSIGEHRKKDSPAEDLILNKCSVPLRTMVYKNVIKETPWEKSLVTNSDNFLISLLGHYGKSKYHHDITPACYRLHPGGVWSMANTHQKRADKINTYYWMYRYYQRMSLQKYADFYFKKMTNRFITIIDTPTVIIEALGRALGIRILRKWLKRIKSGGNN